MSCTPTGLFRTVEFMALPTGAVAMALFISAVILILSVFAPPAKAAVAIEVAKADALCAATVPEIVSAALDSEKSEVVR